MLAASVLYHTPKANTSDRRDYKFPYIRVEKKHLKAVVEFNQNHDCQDVLEAMGWLYTKELNRKSPKKDLVYYSRPGKKGKQSLWHKSGSVWTGKNTFYCHSTNARLPDKVHLTPFDLLCFLKFNENINQTISYIVGQKIT
jgi:hypothetical protein